MGDLRYGRLALGTKHVGVDARGLWLGVGRARRDWVEWEQVEAVRVAPSGSAQVDGTEGELEIAPPYLEVHVPKSVAQAMLPFPHARLVDGPWPAPGVTGKRFVVALEDGPGAGRELADAVDRFAPGKLLDGARGGQST